jgi:cell division protein FtsL
MIVKEFEYINGNIAEKPERRIRETDKKKYEELQRSKQERNKRLKEEAKKKKNGVLQVAAFIFIMGIFIISRDSNVYNSQKSLDTINSEIKVVKDENEALRVELLKVSSLENIKTKAETKLGMVPATKENTIQLQLPNEYFDNVKATDD